MKYLSITPFLLVFCAALSAQTTPGQLLATAWDDDEVQLLRERQAYLEANQFELPLLRKLELRTSTRDLDPKQQDYALRLSTNGFGMKRTQAAIYGSMKQMTEAERTLLVHEALTRRYELVLDVFFNRRHQDLLALWKNILLDKKAVYGQLLSLGLEQDIDDLFRTEDDLLQLERDLFKNSSDDAEFRLRMKIFTGKPDTLTPVQSLVPLDEIRQVAASIAAGNSLPSPTLQRRQAQSAMALLNAEMERMEARHLLNYLQFRYTGNAKDLVEDRFSIGAGFDLPWPNESKLKLQELHLDVLESQAEFSAEQQALNDAILLKNNALLQLFSQLDLLRAQADAFRTAYDPQRLLTTGLNNPETLLRLKESLVRMDIESANLEKNIYQAYLSLLSETGLLTAQPLRDYLTGK